MNNVDDIWLLFGRARVRWQEAPWGVEVYGPLLVSAGSPTISPAPSRQDRVRMDNTLSEMAEKYHNSPQLMDIWYRPICVNSGLKYNNTTGWIRIQCKAIVGMVWMTTNVYITYFDLTSWFASESWPDQTRLLCLIHTKFIIILSWYRAHYSLTLNFDSPCITKQ